MALKSNLQDLEIQKFREVATGTASVGVTSDSLAFGEDPDKDVMKVEDRVLYAVKSSSGLVLAGAGKLAGVFPSIASGTPTIKFWDNTSGTITTMIETFTPTAGLPVNFGKLVKFNTGLYISIGGTVTCTVFYQT